MSETIRGAASPVQAAADAHLHRIEVRPVMVHREYGVLLLRAPDGRWSLPGGSLLAAGEETEAAVRRGVRETTGIFGLTIGPVVASASLPAAAAGPATLLLAVRCVTDRYDVHLGGPFRDGQWQWIRQPAEIAGWSFVHPLHRQLVLEVVGQAGFGIAEGG